METTEQLSRQAIDEFKDHYEDEFGEELPDDQVKELAVGLLHFFGILAKAPELGKTE